MGTRSSAVTCPNGGKAGVPLATGLEPISFLLGRSRAVSISCRVPSRLSTPMVGRAEINEVHYALGKGLVYRCPICAARGTRGEAFGGYLRCVFRLFSVRGSCRGTRGVGGSRIE